MLNLVLWLALLAGFVGLVTFAWRSAMRRRGFKLIGLLEKETVLRAAVDVPFEFGGRSAAWRRGPLARRGTVVLTRRRIAGFAHRARFVLVRGTAVKPGAVRADGEWLVVRPAGRRSGGSAAPEFRFLIPEAAAWSSEADRVLRRR